MRLFLIIGLFIFSFLLGGCSSEAPSVSATATDSLQRQIRRRIAEKRKIEALRRQLLQGKLGRSIQQYKPIIKKYAKRYGFDWRLIVAQIVKESGFKTKARSHVGARGLMQLMPGTVREISKELDIEHIIRNPRENITAGIYHLQKQYRYFPDAPRPDRAKLALASYNCGVGRIFDAQDIARYYRQPANRWNTVRPYLAMLKKTDWQLHLQVWPTGRPRFGYFYGYNETINYVENIWSLYQMYQKIL